MDRNIRRVLYTALVAGGLVVVGASSAHAAGEGLLDPVTPGATETIEDASTVRDDLDAGTGASPAGTGADAAGGDGGPVDAVEKNGEGGLADGIVGDKGIVRSLLSADVGAVVDGTLGKDGLVDDLLTGVPPDDVEEPGPDAPGPEDPGADPGSDGPGTIDPPVPGEPGTGEPGTEEPGTEEPGTEEPGTEEPGTDGPGAGDAGKDEPGRLGRDDHAPGGGTNRPGTGEHGTVGRDTPAATETPSGETLDGWTAAGPGSSGSDDGTPGSGNVGPESPEDHGTPADEPDTDRDGPGDGVDLGWRDEAATDPSYDGTILVQDLGDGLDSTPPEPDEEESVAPIAVPDDALPEAGHMITGQLSLISLLLGLGIAALRMRRR